MTTNSYPALNNVSKQVYPYFIQIWFVSVTGIKLQLHHYFASELQSSRTVEKRTLGKYLLKPKSTNSSLETSRNANRHVLAYVLRSLLASAAFQNICG